MRGSPLFRTLLILVVIIAAGILITDLTKVRDSEDFVTNSEDISEKAVEARIPAKIYLTLSEPAKTLEFSDGDKEIRFEGEPGTELSEWTDDLSFDPAAAVLFLKVEWSEESQQNRRFAKLVVEAEGKQTFTHYFDAEGEIDDFVELPF